mmetsp:Transcript_20739/g.45575  ORF Transcript_20739/g.45575 Transcript_20739/m.45575 type:complete len:106 (+) Transcript_20739:1017-1334(+)
MWTRKSLTAGRPLAKPWVSMWSQGQWFAPLTEQATSSSSASHCGRQKRRKSHGNLISVLTSARLPQQRPLSTRPELMPPPPELSLLEGSVGRAFSSAALATAHIA